ncbi:DEAD/DEAH box helicase [Xylanimonas ulmi]|uniref:DEAD/DEAH box helicase domain-containing protein n=1 Tax=Xylanimonas ulmi TaxID=228973 RepID=A0A4Q7M617_9MICO|nr:DEAD/DEAH box helicase [Xylanibacterium ulmi]RZS62921.1 DEAD/DEAH box helicase domain-containing protein [Xylanibacterium ulmi]
MSDVAAHPLLDVLLAGGARADRLTHVRTLPARPGVSADWPAWADPALVAAYRSLGVERPWAHQAVAASAAWEGRHVALATSTGSGKSLAFWLPALTAVGRDLPAQRRGAVLYLSPTKALAADQLAALERVLAAMPDGAGRGLRVATCDGDTPTEERRWTQDYADVVLTNPDFLHFSLLPNHRRWARLLRALRYVVVDEGHTYRGVFGAHVSLVLRRLARLVEHHRGGTLTFVVASATSAEPAASAARLLGVGADDVAAVVADASPSGRRTVALWQPPEVASSGFTRSGAGAGAGAGVGDDDPWLLPDPLDPGHAEGEQAPVVTVEGGSDHPRRTATAEVADLLADLAAHGARTLAFTRSRRGAESVAQAARDHLRPVSTDLSRRVAAYRGGYLPEERRELEQAIRTGALLGLATTNALELGVDISGLDAVLIAGWPGTRMSLWQQAGRAGRAGADGLVAFVAREDPLDTYLVTHPEAVFDAPLEATVFDPANRYVLAPQLCAAAQEVPLRTEDLARFGEPGHVRAVLDELVEGGALRRRPSGWYWTHAQPAASMADLRGSGGRPVRVVEAPTGRLLGTVDAGSADGQVHDGAVYVHQGATFVVDHLDLTDRVALVVRRDVDHGTWSREVMTIAIEDAPMVDPTVVEPVETTPPPPPAVEPVETTSSAGVVSTGSTTADSTTAGSTVTRAWGPITWGLGPVEVTSQVVSFERRRLPDLQVLGTEPLDLPERSLPTTAVWWSAPDFVLRAAGLDPDVVPGALHAAEHASIGLLPLLATCDRWDLGGISTDLHADTGQATVFVYDAYPGGAGFAERGYHLGAVWLRATRDAIAACPCDHGCPACVQSPKCGTYNSPLDKAAAVTLLDAVLAHAPS